MAIPMSRATLIPRLGAVAGHYPGGTPYWKVWCVHCQRWHVHGAGPGHRVAHCHDSRSPYYDTGYILVEPEPEDEVF